MSDTTERLFRIVEASDQKNEHDLFFTMIRSPKGGGIRSKKEGACDSLEGPKD